MARQDISDEQRLSNLKDEQQKSHNKRRRKRIGWAVKKTENAIRERKFKKKSNIKKSGK